jgi:hypothetical protein
MGRALVRGRAGFRRFGEAFQVVFQALEAAGELPQFRLQFERDAMEPLEVVLQMSDGRFEREQAVGGIGRIRGGHRITTG